MLLICWSAAGSANEKIGADAAKQLMRALSQVQKTPDDRKVQERYLEAFPQTYPSFLELFDLNHPLYDGHEYVETLYSLAESHELDVGRLLVRLSKDAHYEADAPSYLQNSTVTFGSQHTKTFLALLKQLPVGKQANLITFLADVENHQAYPEYQLIIDHSKALDERSFVRKFEAARAKRSRQPHD
jgi:hypothetical protein